MHRNSQDFITAAGATPLALVLCLAWVVGCGGGEGGSTSPAGGPSAIDGGNGQAHEVPSDQRMVETAGECAAGTKVGEFKVELHPDDNTEDDEDRSSTAVDGNVGDRVAPSSIREVLAEEAGCAMVRPYRPFCDPGCGPNQTCNLENVCEPAPRNQDLGTVYVRGLEADVAMDPIPPGNTYFDTKLPHPGFLPGAEILMDSRGGVIADLMLEGEGVTPLIESGTGFSIARDSPVNMSWEPDASSEHSRIRATLSIDQHGVLPATIVCHFADEGSAVVPASLVNMLLDAGVTGFSTGTLTRETVDSQETESGCVEFRVASPINVDIDVEGHTACDEANPCPEGQICSIFINTCV